MFKNMSRRERILATIVACTLPLMVGLWGVTAFSRTYLARKARIRDLTQQIDVENERQMNAELAQQRRRYYRKRSLPTDLNQAKIQYDAWLTEIVEKRAQMELDSVTPGRANNTVRFLKGNKRIDVYDEVSFKVRAKGTIGQIVTLLTEFYTLDMMHRISSLSITPVTKAGGSAGSEVLTGQLKVEFDINVISLSDADKESDFVRELAGNTLAWETLTKSILSRNIFGPANNTPTISSSNRTFETGKPIELALVGDDVDEQDQLLIEYLGGKVEGGELFQDKSDRRATLKFPALPEGRYEVKVRVTDNGFPAKMTERDIAFNVNTPRIPEVRVEPPKPKFKHAQAAVIRGVVKDKTGADVCWIEVETINQSFKLKVGESFELDDKNWTIRTIESRQVTIQVGDLLQTFRLGSRLDSPTSSTQVGELSATTTGGN